MKQSLGIKFWPIAELQSAALLQSNSSNSNTKKGSKSSNFSSFPKVKVEPLWDLPLRPPSVFRAPRPATGTCIFRTPH